MLISKDAKQLACAYVLFYQETTLEAVLKEQEMEGQHHASAPTAARTSDVDAAKDLLTPLSKDPHTILATTPLHEDLEHMDHLSHAVTAPALGARAATADDLTNTPTFNPIMPVKSKKELKVEEKERKAKEKADKKLEEQKRKEASDARMKVWREQNEQFKRIRILRAMRSSQRALLTCIIQRLACDVDFNIRRRVRAGIGDELFDLGVCRSLRKDADLDPYRGWLAVLRNLSVEELP